MEKNIGGHTSTSSAPGIKPIAEWNEISETVDIWTGSEEAGNLDLVSLELPLAKSAHELLKELKQARTDISIFLAQIYELLNEDGGDLDDEDRALLHQIDKAYSLESSAISKATGAA